MYLSKNGLLPDSFNHMFLLIITVTYIHVILEVRIPTSRPRTQRIPGAYTKKVRKSSTVIDWTEFPATMSRKVTDFSCSILIDFCVVMFYTSFWTDLFTGSSVQFVKQYATHKVLYNGEVKERKMMGHWRLESFQSVKGEWKMWPVGSGHWTVHLSWVSILGFSLSSGSFY